MKILNLTFMLPILLLAGCSGKSKTLEHEISLPFTCSGPIFEGSNTAAPEFQNFMDSLLKANGLKAEQVQSVKLVSASMSTDDSIGFDATSSATVSMLTRKADIKEVAVLNPIAKGSKSITLKTSDERELREYFNEQLISMVCDLNFGTDRDADFHLKGNFRFRITVKE